jgi:DNA-binding LacI/PurR family transcriptional regulator
VTPRKIVKPRSTITEVAQRAGVAKTTVSHALSGKRPVAPDTRERIFKAMRELQYAPNPIARRLAGSPGRTIALVLPLASPTIADVEVRYIASIGAVVNQHGYTFLTLTAPQVNVDDLRQIVYSGLVDGVLLMRIQQKDERVTLLRETDIPFVMIGRTRDNRGLMYVDLNGEAAIGLAVDHLAGFGHRRIGFICPDDLNFAFAQRIVKGFEKSCQQHQLPRLMAPAVWSAEAGYRALSVLVGQSPDLSAVIVWSEVVTVGVLSALRDLGHRIPEDISVISFDRSEHLHLASSDLTVIDTRPEAVGAQAAQMLIQVLQDEPVEHAHVLMPPLLIAGKSTQACPGLHPIPVPVSEFA